MRPLKYEFWLLTSGDIEVVLGTKRAIKKMNRRCSKVLIQVHYDSTLQSVLHVYEWHG